MLLNENRNWEGDVAEIVTDIPSNSKVKDAFFQGRAKRVPLAAGKRLYKFNNLPTLTAPGGTTLSPWWSPYEEYEHDPGWEGRVRLAAHLNVSVRELGRLTSVVKENWNSLEWLMVVPLAVPIFAFWGTFKGMDRIDPGAASKMVVAGNTPGFKAEGKGQSKGLPGAGGASQFYIPDLTIQHVGTPAPESLLNK